MHIPDSMLRVGVLAVALICGMVRADTLQAQDKPPEPISRDSSLLVRLDTLKVTGRADDLIGIARSASQGFVGVNDLRSRPITREGELLEGVPGMIVTQHSGEGKANQYFVRGFNLDHGTDFQTRVEGMPINMPTHGHGQGWTDLNFLIPELVDYLDYRLGVHHTEIGDFGSAGGAEFHLVNRLARPFVTVGIGAYGMARLAGGASTRIRNGDLLLGGELKGYDGPWEQPQRVRKFSGLARYSWARGASKFSVLGLAYTNGWNSPDQIPLRAVASGIIGRFGQVDDSDGGNAQRYSISGSWRRTTARTAQEVQLFGIHSNLDLFSNFTYFLEDADGGDQFSQSDRRRIIGGNAKHTQAISALGIMHLVRAGVQTRTDLIDDVALNQTEARRIKTNVRADRVREIAAGMFVESESAWRPWLRTVLGVRTDGYLFDVTSDRVENSGNRSAGIVSPKVSLVVTPMRDLELYVNGGFGFHSNDARGTTIMIDPATGERAQRVDPLVRSRGAEVGLRASPVSGSRSTLTLWALDLDSELLFVGDAGATEPSAPSNRRGVTWTNFYRPHPALVLDADVSFAWARLGDTSPGEDRIPGAIENVYAGGIAWSPEQGLLGALRLRHFGAYPLIEDNSVRADRSTLLSADIGYLFKSGLRIDAVVLNLLNSRAADVQYYYRSRLRGEPIEGVEDIHFHPVEPRQVRVTVRWVF